MATFGSGETLEIKMVVDSTEAERSVEKVGKAVDKVEKETKGLKDEFKDTGTRAKEQFAKAAVAVAKVGAAVALGVGAFKAMQAVVARVNTQFDTLASAKLFSVTLQDASQLQGVLSDVKTQFEALSLATEAAQLGLSQEEIQRFAHLVNVLAAVTGESKATLEARLKTGQITDRELGALSKITGQIKTQAGLQNQMLRQQAAQGGAALEQGQRIQALLQFTGASAAMERSLGELGKANPFDEIAKDLRSIGEGIVKDLMPAIRDFADALKGLKGPIRDVASTVTGFLQKSATGWAQLYVRITKGQAALDATLRNAAAAEQQRQQRAQQALEDRLEAELEAVKKRYTAEGRAAAAAERRRKAQAKARQQAQSEALQEQIARQGAARAALRNFERSALAAISAQGAAGIGPVIAGMAQALELAKQFTAQLGPNFLEATSKSARRAQFLVKSAMEAGLGGLDNMIKGEQQRTNNLRAALLVSQSQVKEQQVQNELINKRKTLGQAEVAINRTIAVLEKSRSDIATRMINSLLDTLDLVQAEAKEQEKLLKLTLQLAKVEERASLASQRVQAAQAEASATEQLRTDREKLAQLDGFIVRDRGDAALATMKDLEAQAQLLRIEITRLTARQKIAQTDADRSLLANQISDATSLLKLTQQRADTQARIALSQSAQAKLAAEQYRLEQQRQALTRKGQLAEQRARIAGLQAGVSGQPGEVAAMAQVRSLQAQIAEQEATRLSLEKQRRQLNPASQQAQRMAAQITFLRTSVDLRKQELDVTRQQVQLEEYRRTGLGAFVMTLRDSVKNTTAEIGQLAANQFLGLAQRISGAFSTIFTDMVVQPEQALSNFGKSILSALGDVALSFAAVFAAKAAGFLVVPGGQATAAGLFAASAGLGVLGGLLKGGAAVVGGQGQSSTSTAPSSTFQASVPGQTPPQEAERQIVIFNNINSVPWRRARDTAPAEYRSMARWAEAQARATGIKIGGLG